MCVRARQAGRKRLGKDPAIRRDLERDRLLPWAEGGEGLVRQNAEAKGRGASFTAGHAHTAACVSGADTGLTYCDLLDYSVYFSHPTPPPQLICIHVCACMWVCTCECGAHRDQNRGSDSLEVELQAVVSGPVRVLGTEPQVLCKSSMHSYYRAISPAP